MKNKQSYVAKLNLTVYDAFMKRFSFIAILVCLVLSACAGTPQPPAPNEPQLALPEGFIGTWDYRPAYKAVDVIRPDGIIESRSKETGELLKTSEYRVVYVENSRSVYILVKDRADKPELTDYEYIHLSNRLIYDKKKPERIEVWYSCLADKEEWQKPLSELQKRILHHEKYDCDVITVQPTQDYYSRYEP